jgi:integrase
VANLTDTMVGELPAPAAGYKLHWLSGQRVDKYEAPTGFAVRVMASGQRSFLLSYRDKDGREHRYTIGQHPAMKLVQAIRDAAAKRLALDGEAEIIPPKAKRSAEIAQERLERAVSTAKSKTLDKVLDEWTDAKGHKLRSFVHSDGAFRRYLRPMLGAVPVADLRKDQIREMRNAVAAKAGPIMARKCIEYLGAVLGWYAGEVDDYFPPVLKGLKGEQVSRDRMLTHDEIRAIWPACDHLGHFADFGRIVRLLLLTGQRRNEIAEARWSEIDMDGATLTIPAARYKTKRNHTVPFSEPAMIILRDLPRRPASDRLFPTFGIDHAKRKLDKIAPTATPWVLHDLRRTATSLMIEAGVRPDWVERVTHPTITGIAGVYNRFAYADEKRAAVDALASILARITGSEPTGGNVVPLRA